MSDSDTVQQTMSDSGEPLAEGPPFKAPGALLIENALSLRAEMDRFVDINLHESGRKIAARYWRLVYRIVQENGFRWVDTKVGSGYLRTANGVNQFAPGVAGAFDIIVGEFA